jgi:hypothetical protein
MSRTGRTHAGDADPDPRSRPADDGREDRGRDDPQRSQPKHRVSLTASGNGLGGIADRPTLCEL